MAPLVDRTAALDTATAQLPLDPRVVRGVLGSLMLVSLLAALDSTVVATALPSIVSDLHGNDVYTWVFMIYLLTMTVSMPMFASISDRLGRQPVLFLGVAIFLVGSALCGLANEMWQLLLFRGLQGFGAGAILPVSQAIVGDLFPPADRARYQPLLGSTMIFAFLIGPTMGGMITDSYGWNWIFYLNIPLGLLALLVMARTMPKLKPMGIHHRFDVTGVVVFACAVVPFLIGLKNKPDGDWTDPAVGGLILLGVVAGLLFVLVELRAEEPIVPVRLFRDPTFAAASAIVLLSVAGLFVSITFMPRFFQFVRGASATESGWQIMSLLMGLILGAIVAGQVVGRTGRWKLPLLGAMSLGLVGMILLTTLQAGSDLPFVWFAMFLTGVGLGPVTAVLTAVVQTAVAPAVLAVATSTLTFCRQLGASIWLAIGGTMFASGFADRIPGALADQGVPAPVVASFAADGAVQGDELTGLGDLGARILAALPEAVRDQVQPFVAAIVAGVHQAFSAAVGDVFWVGIAGVGAAIVVLAVVREVPIPKEALTTRRQPDATAGPVAA
jgi:EmrB/QacA subfamily drug resistance transporter